MKKINKINKTLIISAIGLLSFGCSKITNINVSPNNPPIDKATPQLLLTSAVASTAGRVGGELNILGGIWSQFWTQNNTSNQYKNIDSYNLIRTDLNGNYQELFAGSLEDLNTSNSLTKASGQWQYYLMGTVMEAYTYEVLVDLYDQVPYSQAFQGAANLQPKFDDGFTIYKALIAQIDDALTKNYNLPYTGGDIIFGGDMTKWVQFANTLELKMYLRMVNAHPADAQAGVQKLYAAGANFLNDNAGVSSSFYTDAAGKDNPFYDYNIRTVNTTTNLRASFTFKTWLTTNSDPRTVVYFGIASPVPIHQGDFTATATQQPTYSTATSPVQKANDPVWFMTKAESHFLQSEAALRYGVGGAGADLTQFNLGVTAAFAEYSLTAPTTGVYAYPTGTQAVKLRAIIMQKWASFAGGCHTLEAFFDQERTGYPVISPVYSKDAKYLSDPLYVLGQIPGTHIGEWVYSANGVTGGLFPKRLVFPDVERSRNVNTPTEVPLTTKVWWGL